MVYSGYKTCALHCFHDRWLNTNKNVNRLESRDLRTTPGCNAGHQAAMLDTTFFGAREYCKTIISMTVPLPLDPHKAMVRGLFVGCSSCLQAVPACSRITDNSFRITACVVTWTDVETHRQTKVPPLNVSTEAFTRTCSCYFSIISLQTGRQTVRLTTDRQRTKQEGVLFHTLHTSTVSSVEQPAWVCNLPSSYA